MASVYPKTHPRTAVNRSINFRVNGKLIKIAAGKRDLSSAQEVAGYITRLENHLKTDTQPPADLLASINGLPAKVQERIYKSGLLVHEGFDVSIHSPAELVEWYLKQRAGQLKPNSLKSYKDRLSRFVEWCESKGITDVGRVTVANLESFKAEQVSKGRLSSSKHTMRRVKLFFNAAHKQGMIRRNPALSVESNTGSQRTDLVYISPEWFPALLNCVKTADLRTSLALARYAGCRIPSEITNLKWSDYINIEKNPAILIPNVKTQEVNEPIRRVPVFNPLREYLDNLYQSRFGAADMTSPGLEHADEYIIENEKLRDPKHSHAGRLLTSGTWDRWRIYWESRQVEGTPFFSGLVEQPALEKNCRYLLGSRIPQVYRAARRSFVNDLISNGVPLKTAAACLGHSVAVMSATYLDVTENDKDFFERTGLDVFKRPQ